MKVKINPLAEAFRFIGKLNLSKDRDPAQQQDSRQQQGRNPKEEAAEQILEVTDEKVLQAVQAFGADATSKSNGLAATISGRGPGLRVVLSDSSGAKVRQYTGEEFLKLRATATQDGRTRGKLLDQKF